jgi:hypothetical protein
MSYVNLHYDNATPYAAARAVANPFVTALAALDCCNDVIVTLVNVPAAGTVLPILTLLIDPVVAGLIIRVPDPVGRIVMFAFAGLKVTAPVATRVENTPNLGVIDPIDTLSIDPILAGLRVNELVTLRSLTEKFELVLIVNVCVVEFVVRLIPPDATKLSVLFE